MATFNFEFRGKVSEETVVLRRCRVLQDNLVLSTALIMWIGHRKEIRKLTFRALALRRRSESDEGLTLETSAFESLYGGQFTFLTQLIKPKLSFNFKYEIG